MSPLMMMAMMMLTAYPAVIIIIIAARQKHLDPRVNIVNWQRGQQLLNDLNKTLSPGRLYCRGGGGQIYEGSQGGCWIYGGYT